MIQKVSSIVEKNFMVVDILDGVRRIQDVFYEKNIECFTAYENERLVGVITKKELVSAHPNRIIADVMSNKYICMNGSTPIWLIKEEFDSNKGIDIILVEDKSEIIGFVTRTTINVELGKHIDLLTGFYKSDYIFYNAYNLIDAGKEASLIFIDLDNFGYIDKKYGHIYGDEILKKVSEILKANVNTDTYLCRYAGDEFAILTPYCIDESRVIAERLIDAIKAYEFPNKIPVSASIGITGYKMNNEKISNIINLVGELINIASLASTRAKKEFDTSIAIEVLDINAIA